MAIGRPLQFDPDVALDAAMQIFWRKGFEATSLQDLLKGMGLSKSSFYQAFESKEALFLRCLKRYRATNTGQMREELSRATSGWDFLEAWLAHAAQDMLDMRGPDARRGCMLVNTAGEFAQTDARIAALVSANFSEIRAILVDAIRRAQQEGKVAVSKDAAALATYLVSSMSGLRTMVKSGADQETVRGVATIVRGALA